MVYTLSCVHAATTIPPELYVHDAGVHFSGNPIKWEAYFAELEPAKTAILPQCYCPSMCGKLKLTKRNSHISIAEYNGRPIRRTYVSWNITGFPSITKAMAGDYVCENEYGLSERSYQLNVVGK